mgnify:CR=1 FL=1
MMRLQPMLPVEKPLPADESGFIHEIKWDGYRVLAYLDDGDVRLESRNGRNLNHLFPQLVESARQKRLRAILDGEVVALTADGRGDFSLLRSCGIRPRHICYIVFDLLYCQSEDFCPKPWFERRERLETLIESEGALMLSPLLPGSARDCLTFAAEQDFEGIVSKQRNSPYLPGTRSSLWRKQKIRKSLDCILVGVKTGKAQVRSMAVGTYRADGSLFYLGNVGSGLGHEELDFLRQAMELLATSGLAHCPCVNPPPDADDLVWCQPLLVVEIEYFELTPCKRLRHPVFLRFRFDKDPKECRMEVYFDDD